MPEGPKFRVIGQKNPEAEETLAGSLRAGHTHTRSEILAIYRAFGYTSNIIDPLKNPGRFKIRTAIPIIVTVYRGLNIYHDGRIQPERTDISEVQKMIDKVIRQKELKVEFDRASKEALPVNQSDEMSDRWNRLVSRFLYGEINLFTFRQLTRERDPGVILVETPEEFRWVMIQLGVPKGITDESLVHELKHWKTAIECGLESKMGVRLAKNKLEVGSLRQAITDHEIPDWFNERMARLALRRTMEAPGVDMSASDKLALQRIVIQKS